MKLIKKIKRMIFMVFFLLILALMFFYFWSSSGTIPSEKLSVITIYKNQLPITQKKESIYKIMTYNIGYLSGMANNLPIRMGKNYYNSSMKNFLSFLNREKPDFIGFQEIDYNSYRSYHINQLDSIATGSRYPFAASSINWDKRYVPFPYWPPAGHFRKVLSGQALVSNYSILSVKRIVLEKPKDKPFYYKAFYLDRLIQVIKIKVEHRTLVILNIHLEAFDQKTRENQARVVLKVYQSYKDQFPVLLIGDFNCVPPQAKKKIGFIDEPETDFSIDNTIDIFLREKSLKEAIVRGPEVNNETKNFTYPSIKPTRKLDYIFYNVNKITAIKSYVPNLDCSDHLPVIMEFSFKDGG